MKTTTRRVKTNPSETETRLSAKKGKNTKKAKEPRNSILESQTSRPDEYSASKTRQKPYDIIDRSGRLSIDVPKNIAHYRLKDLTETIDRRQAQKFWQLDRPYFFAIQKDKPGPPNAIDLEELSKNSKMRSNFYNRLDEKFSIFFIKSATDLSPSRLPSLKSMIEFGVPEYPLENFWTLSTERNPEHETIWLFSSRVILASLFKIKNALLQQDIPFANIMTRNLSRQELQNGLNGALYLATHSSNHQMVKVLLAAGAHPDVSAGLYGAQTGLAVAVERRSFAAIEEYLKAGADPDYSGDIGTTTGRESAEDAQDTKIFSLFEKYKK